MLLLASGWRRTCKVRGCRRERDSVFCLSSSRAHPLSRVLSSCSVSPPAVRPSVTPLTGRCAPRREERRRGAEVSLHADATSMCVAVGNASAREAGPQNNRGRARAQNTEDRRRCGSRESDPSNGNEGLQSCAALTTIGLAALCCFSHPPGAILPQQYAQCTALLPPAAPQRWSDRDSR